MIQKLAVAAAAAAVCVGLAGCGAINESTQHNAPTPDGTTDVHAVWHRIQSPGNYATIVTTCVGADGIYETQSGANLFVVANDPNCAGAR